MSLRQHVQATLVAIAIGLTFNTVQAGCTHCASQMETETTSVSSAPTYDISVRSDSEFVVDIPEGTTIHLPAGTRLWRAAPVVISDVRVSDLLETKREEIRDASVMADTKLVTTEVETTDTVDESNLTEALEGPWATDLGKAVATAVNTPLADIAEIAQVTAAKVDLDTPPLSDMLIDEDMSDEPVFDLYADSQVPTSTEELAEETASSAWLLEQTQDVADPSTVALRLLETSNREPLASNAAKLAELETAADQGLTVGYPLYKTTDKTAQKGFGWLPPFVLIPVMGLFWAERIRRDRAKERFARAMEHGERIHRLAASKANRMRQEAAAVERAAEMTTATSMTTVRMKNSSPTETMPETAMANGEMLPVLPPALPTVLPVNESNELPILQPTTLVADSNQYSPEVTTHETEVALPALANSNQQTPEFTTDMPVVETVVALPAVAGYATQDLAGSEIMNVENLVDGTENDPRIGTTTTDWTVIDPNENEDVAANMNADYWAVGSPVIPPNAEQDVDVELDQLTGMLEDTNAMRAEISGFEKRNVEFRERWREREETTANDGE